jgi:hypothetical protein
MTDPVPSSAYDPDERFVDDVLVDEPPPPLRDDEDGEADMPEIGGEG